MPYKTWRPRVKQIDLQQISQRFRGNLKSTLQSKPAPNQVLYIAKKTSIFGQLKSKQSEIDRGKG